MRKSLIIMDMVVERDVIRTAHTEGLREGWREGKTEGKTEERTAIVKNSLRQGLEPVVIAAITGLTVEKVHEIVDGSNLIGD